MPTIVEPSALTGVVIVGDVGLAIPARWGKETAVNEVLGFAGRDGEGISGGGRNLAGEDVAVVPLGCEAEMPDGVRVWVYVEGEGEGDGLGVAMLVLVLDDAVLVAVGVVVPALLVFDAAVP